MKATFKKIRIGSKIKDSIGDVLTIEEIHDNVAVASWAGRGALWIFGSQLGHYELVKE